MYTVLFNGLGLVSGPDICSRKRFLVSREVATIQDTGDYPNADNLKALVFAMHAGLLPEEHVCATCHQPLKLKCRSDRTSWEWVQKSRACLECERTNKSVVTGMVLQSVYGKNWLHVCDAFCMWTFDNPPKLIQTETGVHHKQLSNGKPYGTGLWSEISTLDWLPLVWQQLPRSLRTKLVPRSALQHP